MVVRFIMWPSRRSSVCVCVDEVLSGSTSVLPSGHAHMDEQTNTHIHTPAWSKCVSRLTFHSYRCDVSWQKKSFDREKKIKKCHQ